MAKVLVSVFGLTDVLNSSAATDVIEKRFIALNGYDAALRKDAKLLVFSSSMKEEDRKRGESTFKAQFFWALDMERNKLVKISRTGLTGGMGYEQLPAPGMWSLNDDKTWYILKPNDDDPAVQTRKSWGINRLLPGAFEYDHKQISIPKCFVIEVNKIDYLCSRNPIDAAASNQYLSKELEDTTFKPDTARMWDGVAYYPTREQIQTAIKAYNDVHDTPFTDDTISMLCK